MAVADTVLLAAETRRSELAAEVLVAVHAEGPLETSFLEAATGGGGAACEIELNPRQTLRGSEVCQRNASAVAPGVTSVGSAGRYAQFSIARRA